MFSYLNEEDECLFVGGRVDRAEVFLHIAWDVAQRRSTQLVELVDDLYIIGSGKTDDRRRCRWFIKHTLLTPELRLFFTRQQQNRDEGVAGAAQQQQRKDDAFPYVFGVGMKQLSHSPPEKDGKDHK